MNTLYININSSKQKSTSSVTVIEYDFLSDFYYALGEELSRDSSVEVDKYALMSDYEKDECVASEHSILGLAESVKHRLWERELPVKLPISLPSAFFGWMRYNSNSIYRQVYENRFAGDCGDIYINLLDFYEFSELKRNIVKHLKTGSVKEIVFSDAKVSSDSYIVRSIMKEFPEVSFISFKQWQDRMASEKAEADRIKAQKEEEARIAAELKKKEEADRALHAQQARESLAKIMETVSVAKANGLKENIFTRPIIVEVYGLKIEFGPTHNKGLEFENKTSIFQASLERNVMPLINSLYVKTSYSSLKITLYNFPWDSRFAFDGDLYKSYLEQAYKNAIKKHEEIERFNKRLIQKLFPIDGRFTLGQTSVNELVAPSMQSLFNQQVGDKIRMSYKGMTIYQEFCDNASSVMEIDNRTDFPEKWTNELGLSWNISLKAGVKKLHDNGFVLSKIESPYYTPSPKVEAYTPDGQYQLIFTFSQHHRTKWGCEMVSVKIMYHGVTHNLNKPDLYEKYCREWSYYDF